MYVHSAERIDGNMLTIVTICRMSEKKKNVKRQPKDLQLINNFFNAMYTTETMDSRKFYTLHYVTLRRHTS